MNLRRLRWLGIALPALFLIALELGRDSYLEPMFAPLAARVIAITIMIVGVFAFSCVVFALIARMEEELLQRNRHLTATNQILGSLTESWNLDRVLPQALDRILDVIQVEFGVLSFVDEERDELIAIASRGIPDELATSMARMKLPDGLETDVIRSRMSEQIDDVLTDPSVVESLKRLGVQSIVPVPLRTKGRVRGLAHIGSRRQRQFSAIEIQLLESMGTQIAMAIENRWLFAESRKQSERVRALNEIGIDLTAELSLESLLEKIVEISRSLVGARYGALAVLDRDGRVGRFLTSGLTSETEALIGALPEGHGLLGLLLKKGEPLRLSDISGHPAGVGFPAGHPQMTTFLGIPIASKGEVIGSLYLTDKDGGEDFNQADQEAVATLAAQAAVAIENARLYEQLQDLAAFQERERIAMDLHDGVIQSIYAIGLNLESCTDMGGEDRPELRRRLEKTIDGLNEVIEDIRRYIFDLRSTPRPTSLRRALEHAVDELRLNGSIEAHLIAEEFDDITSQERVQHLSQIAREAAANIIKHAKANTATIQVAASRDRLCLSVRDDGVGFDWADLMEGSGQGIGNMRHRAQGMGGELFVRSAPGSGTVVEVSIPLSAEPGEEAR